MNDKKVSLEKEVIPSVKKGRESVNEDKKALVNELVKLINDNNIIGVVNLENLPAKQLNNMRRQLKGKITLFMTKKKLIWMALNQSNKPSILSIEPFVKGMPALLFTSENPFSLFKLLKKSKSTAPIKAGQKAPREIIVKAGPTSFAPGPIIGELGMLKIKAGIEGGKVAIKSDAVVAKEGDVVNDKLAGLLSRLGIEPMEIGLNLTVVYENGNLLTVDVLDIDEDAYRNNLVLAAGDALSLALSIGYPVKETINLLLSKAYSEAYSLSKEANIITSETIKENLAKAEAEMKALKSAAKIE